MIISTKKPSKNPKGYTITFDANGGKFADDSETNEMVYSESGSLISGTYKIPVHDEGSFEGWFTKKGSGTEYSLDANQIPIKNLTEDITVYAHYKPQMKYAVAIYGICVDDVKDLTTGEISKGGITFGPATGENYVQSFKKHTPNGNTARGNSHRCVHEDSWDEIIQWNKTDPYVYEDCIQYGCTHSVGLNQKTTKTILSDEFNSSVETGDGPSVLYYELVRECEENLRWHPNGGSFGSNNGGWGTSRIRAMLNGADKLTDIKEDNYADYYKSDLHKSSSIYTSENCLFATLPKELQDAIGFRVVKYDSVHNAKTPENLRTSYDKLWLFSPVELGDVSYEFYNHPLEGQRYQKCKYFNDISDGESKTRAYGIDEKNGNSKGAGREWWLRSFGSYDSNDNEVLTMPGRDTYLPRIGYIHAGYSRGVSFGFTLKR